MTQARMPDYFAGDVYALAVLLWELWFQRAPFDDLDGSAIGLLVCQGQRPPLSSAASSDALGNGPTFPEDTAPMAMPAKLRRLIKICWAQAPHDRIPVAEMLTAFDRFVTSTLTPGARAEDTNAREVAGEAPQGSAGPTALASRLTRSNPKKPKRKPPSYLRSVELQKSATQSNQLFDEYQSAEL